MLYHLLYPLHTSMPVFNVFRYITFRTAGASVTALAISLVVGPVLIRRLRDFQIGQVIRQDGPQTHRAKAGTPTMGGLLIMAASLVPTLLWADLTNAYVWIAVLATVAFGVVGFADDYLKIVRRSHHGLLAPLQDGVADRHRRSPSAFALLRLARDRPLQHAPDLSVLQAADSGSRAGSTCRSRRSCCVGATNAVNLTDGLDGLAISVFAVAAAAFTALAYVSTHRVFAEYLQLVRSAPAAAELTIFCGALVGASLGFLWYNSYPADIFMGDVGSLALGGALGTVALLIKQEFLLVIVGGVFVIEAAVGHHPGRRRSSSPGKRVFRMAPLHHHFELIGWSEPKVIARFVILAIIFALFSLTTLKLR